MNRYGKFLLIICFLFIVSDTDAVTVKFEYPFRNVYNLSDSMEASLRILEAELTRDTKNYNLHFVLGSLYIPVDFKKAKKEFESVIKLKPDHYLSYISLGYLTEANNNLDEAITYFKKALSYSPNEPVIYNALATVYMRQNKMDEAKDILEEGIKNINSDESLYFNQTLLLLKFYSGQKEQEKIVRNMGKAIKISPKEEYYFILGVYYLSNKRYEEARTPFENTIKTNPKNIYAILGLATTYKETHQYDKAIELANQALTIDPNNKDVQDEIKEYEEAYKKWKEQNK